MTGKAITLVELDVDIYRATQFELGRASEEARHWSSFWSSGLTNTITAHEDAPADKAVRLERPTIVGNARSMLRWDLMPSLEDLSIVARIRTPISGVRQKHGVVARSDDVHTGYTLVLANTDQILIEKHDGVGATTLVAEAFTWQTGVDYWMRLDVVTQSDGDVFLRGKVWTGNVEDEPSTFMISETDPSSNIPYTTGHVGLFIEAADYLVDCSFFRARSILGTTTETLRFCKAAIYVPVGFDAISSVTDVRIEPATVSLGKDSGKRGKVTIDFTDHPWADLGEFENDGTFWGRFRARGLFRRNLPLRIKRGLEGQALSDFDTSHFVTEEYNGPTYKDGRFTIVAQDVLKLADDNRAQAPRMSQGRLIGSIDNSITTATLSPTGIGNSNYNSSGLVCIGGKEICSFTRVNDILTLTRGQSNTVAISHEADERVQEVLSYAGDTPATIIADLLVNFAGVSSAFIPLAEWEEECATNLGGVIYAREITEPVAVRKLIDQIIEDAALAMWWDERSQLIRLRVLREIATDADLFTEDTLLTGSLQTREQPKERISQIWTFFQQRNPADRGDNEDNYRQALVTVDLEKELEYGSQEIRKIVGHWVATENAAERLNQIQISRFRNPPRNFRFDLFRGTAVTLGNGYRLRWRKNQNEHGKVIMNGAPIQITKVAYEDDRIVVEAEEMLASGVVTLTNVNILVTTGGLLQWEVPADWNSTNNSIHCLSGGGGGSGGAGGGGGGGGGGAAYSRRTNVTLTPGAMINYRVAEGGEGGIGTFGGNNLPNGAGEDGENTWFHGATFATASVAAEGGQGGQGGESNLQGGRGGRANQGHGDLRTNGGDGGDGYAKGDSRAGGAGGGGAGGPNGSGGAGAGLSGFDRDNGGGGGAADGGDDGENPVDNGTGGVGGDNRFSFGGGPGGTSDTPPTAGQEGGGGGGGVWGKHDGAQGGNGEQMWTQTVAPIISAGPGGGGGGGGSSQDGAQGGLYGGGGGGGGQGGNGGRGRQGCIIIIWSDEAGTPTIPPTTLAHHATVTSSNTTITVPATVQAGDLLILLDASNFGPGTPPTGFTTIERFALDANEATVLSYKIATSLDAGQVITGQSGQTLDKILVVYRPDLPINNVSVGGTAVENTSGNPSSQLITASGAAGTSPVLVLAVYSCMNGVLSGISPRTFTPAKDDEASITDTFITLTSESWLAWKIYNAAPVDHTVDMEDEGNSNTLISCWLEIT